MLLKGVNFQSMGTKKSHQYRTINEIVRNREESTKWSRCSLLNQTYRNQNYRKTIKTQKHEPVMSVLTFNWSLVVFHINKS